MSSQSDVCLRKDLKYPKPSCYWDHTNTLYERQRGRPLWGTLNQCGFSRLVHREAILQFLVHFSNVVSVEVLDAFLCKALQKPTIKGKSYDLWVFACLSGTDLNFCWMEWFPLGTREYIYKLIKDYLYVVWELVTDSGSFFRNL